jgi:hypothetical protein
MATNLHIDDKLLARAVKVGGGKSKRQTVNDALAEYVERRSQLKIVELFGTFEDSDFWDPPSTPRRRHSPGTNGKRK